MDLANEAHPEKRHFVQGNIYPVPDPAFPFLGVHFTPRINGDVWLGPNAVLAFSREGYTFGTINVGDLVETLTYPGFVRLASKYAGTGIGEMYGDLVRTTYVKTLQRYIPELRVEDTLPGPSGVRAQAMNSDSSLVHDFVLDGVQNVVHVCNAPSPAATSSLAIGSYVADAADKRRLGDDRRGGIADQLERLEQTKARRERQTLAAVVDACCRQLVARNTRHVRAG